MIDVIDARQKHRIIGRLQRVMLGLQMRVGDDLVGVDELRARLLFDRVDERVDREGRQRVVVIDEADPISPPRRRGRDWWPRRFPISAARGIVSRGSSAWRSANRASVARSSRRRRGSAERRPFAAYERIEQLIEIGGLGVETGVTKEMSGRSPRQGSAPAKR